MWGDGGRGYDRDVCDPFLQIIYYLCNGDFSLVIWLVEIRALASWGLLQNKINLNVGADCFGAIVD